MNQPAWYQIVNSWRGLHFIEHELRISRTHRSIFQTGFFGGQKGHWPFFMQWPLEWPQYEIFAILGPLLLGFFLPLTTTTTIWSSRKSICFLFRHKENSCIIIQEATRALILPRWKGTSKYNIFFFCCFLHALFMCGRACQWACGNFRPWAHVPHI